MISGPYILRLSIAWCDIGGLSLGSDNVGKGMERLRNGKNRTEQGRNAGFGVIWDG
jgi:hypothetical protein